MIHNCLITVCCTPETNMSTVHVNCNLKIILKILKNEQKNDCILTTVSSHQIPHTFTQLQGKSSDKETTTKHKWIYIISAISIFAHSLHTWPTLSLLFLESSLVNINCYIFLRKTIQLHLHNGPGSILGETLGKLKIIEFWILAS